MPITEKDLKDYDSLHSKIYKELYAIFQMTVQVLDDSDASMMDDFYIDWHNRKVALNYEDSDGDKYQLPVPFDWLSGEKDGEQIMKEYAEWHREEYGEDYE